jgi:hypothetical protein
MVVLGRFDQITLRKIKAYFHLEITKLEFQMQHIYFNPLHYQCYILVSVQ